MIGSGSLQCIVGKLTLCTYERQLLASLPEQVAGISQETSVLEKVQPHNLCD